MIHIMLHVRLNTMTKCDGCKKGVIRRHPRAWQTPHQGAMDAIRVGLDYVGGVHHDGQSTSRSSLHRYRAAFCQRSRKQNLPDKQTTYNIEICRCRDETNNATQISQNCDRTCLNASQTFWVAAMMKQTMQRKSAKTMTDVTTPAKPSELLPLLNNQGS